MNKWQTRCVQCKCLTNKVYARRNLGRCKPCVTGEPRQYKRTHDDVLREGGYEDTMGVSPDALEAYRNGGYYGD